MNKPYAATTAPGARPLNAFFTLVRPLPARALLLRSYNAANQNGNAIVRVHRDDPTVTRVFCKIDDTQAAVTPANTIGGLNGFTELRRAGDDFQSPNILVSGIPQNIPAIPVNNKWIGIGAYNAAQNLLAPEVFQFIAVPDLATASVSAKGCLFFAFSADNAVLPHAPGEKFPDNRPFTAAIPIDANHAFLSVPLDNGQPQQWKHSGGDSGVQKMVPVQGETNDEDETKAPYIDPGLLSHLIKPLKKNADPLQCWEGLLTAMWDFGLDNAGAPNPTEVMGIGAFMANAAEWSLDVPSSAGVRAINLRFGSHQEKNWDLADLNLKLNLRWV